MKLMYRLNRALGGLLALSLALVSSMFGQGITSSAISGFVNNQQGTPIGGATVTAIHEPSGTKSTAVTRANGQFNISNLRVGGPYTLTVVGPGAPTEPRKDVYLDVGQTTEVVLAPAAANIVQMQAFKVEGER